MQQEKKYPEWIKNGLPSIAGYYYCKCRVDGSPKSLIVEFDKNGRWGEAPDHDYYESFEIIEWLYESNEQPVEQKENEAVAFAEWMDQQRNSGSVTWKDMKIWGKENAFQLVYNEYQKQNKR